MKCHTCRRRDAEVKLAGSGQRVCTRCFDKLMGRRVAKTVRDNKLLEKGDKIAIAISGGKDSCLLLHWLAKFAKKIPNIKLVAIHAFRGDGYSAKLMQSCEEMCKEAGVELHVASFSKELDVTFLDVVNITKKTGANRCSVCGVFRRRILDSAAKKLGCNKLATGHNLTDEAQSYLMNFIRGDVGPFGHLGPISLPKRKGFVQRIRPLRDLPEEDIRQYVNLKKWTYNPAPCPCRIGSMRHNMIVVMDALKQARPSAEQSIVSSGDKIRALAINRSARTLSSASLKKDEKLASTLLRKCKLCKNSCSGEICRVCQLLALK